MRTYIYIYIYIYKAAHAEASGAAGVVVVFDSEDIFVMGFNGNGTEARDHGLGVFAVSVQKSSGERILAWNAAHSPEESGPRKPLMCQRKCL